MERRSSAILAVPPAPCIVQRREPWCSSCRRSLASTSLPRAREAPSLAPSICSSRATLPEQLSPPAEPPELAAHICCPPTRLRRLRKATRKTRGPPNRHHHSRLDCLHDHHRPQIAHSSSLLRHPDVRGGWRSGRATMASSSFRDSMNSLGWSRREEPANTTQPSGFYGTLQKLNPFNEGNVRLPTHEAEAPGAPLPARSRREEEEGWFARKSSLPYHLHPAALQRATSWCQRGSSHHPQQKRGVHVTATGLLEAAQPACSGRRPYVNAMQNTASYMRPCAACRRSR